MAKPPGKCIFCGNGGLSKEHIWSEWTYRYVPPDPNGHHRKTIYRSVAGIRGLDNSKRHQGLSNALKVRVVCKPCNNGWMSRLEDRAQPVLAPLITDDPCILTIEKQRIVAAWITMKCMVYEMSVGNHDDVVGTPDERRFLMEHLEPPSSWRLWIGRQTGQRFRVGATMVACTLGSAPAGSSLPPTPPNGDFAKNTKAMTMGFGRLVAHIIVTRVPGADEIAPGISRPPVWQQISPATTGIVWRSLNIMNDMAIDSISFALSSFLDRVPWSARPPK